MTETAYVPFGLLGRVREVLDILAAIRRIDAPITSADGLRQAIDLVLRLAEMYGLDRAWIERLTKVARDERVFAVVLAVVQYVHGLAGYEAADGTLRVAMSAGNEEVVVDAQSFLAWLPLVIELISLVRRIRSAS